ncbi:hypothetical protein FGB62_117g113 [Gracilaria domingensis]|nr:hypothetical protein FGB62_117g113 [Gracilaria domingensis]
MGDMLHREKIVMEVGKGTTVAELVQSLKERIANTADDADTHNARAQLDDEGRLGENGHQAPSYHQNVEVTNSIKNTSRSYLTRQSDSECEIDADTSRSVVNVRHEDTIPVRDADKRRPAPREERAVSGRNTGRKQTRKKFRQPRPAKKQRGLPQLDDVQSDERGEIPRLSKERRRMSRKALILRAPPSEENESSSGESEV